MHNKMNIIFKYFMFQIMYDYFVNTTKFFFKSEILMLKLVIHFYTAIYYTWKYKIFFNIVFFLLHNAIVYNYNL